MSHAQIAEVNDCRAAIKRVASAIVSPSGMVLLDCGANSEAIANVMLAYRHLEDASMRLGKVIQALDGGVSVYDRATTVGAD